MSELGLIREQVKDGMDPREVVIDAYRREWILDTERARERAERWRGTPTGDNIEEGRRRANEGGSCPTCGGTRVAPNAFDPLGDRRCGHPMHGEELR